MTASFRIVRKIYTSSHTVSGHASWTCNHSHFGADVNGDWIEKTYPNGDRSYRMVADCNARAVLKLREAA